MKGLTNMNTELKKEYPYLYETHLHTNQSSACANNTGAEMAKAAKEYGYTGIIVTDHAWGGNTSVDRSLSWKDWVTEFAKGYEDAKNFGDKNDFDVFFGYEAGFNGTEFLIYGLTPEWMITHPELKEATIEEQIGIVHQGGGMVIHAHPYREEFYIPEIRLYPEHVDGVEAVNATHSNHLSKSHNDPEFDVRAWNYAKKHSFPMTAGSDVHSINMLGGGVAFKHRLSGIQDYIDSILVKKDYILCNGDEYFDTKQPKLSFAKTV